MWGQNSWQNLQILIQTHFDNAEKQLSCMISKLTKQLHDVVVTQVSGENNDQ